MQISYFIKNIKVNVHNPLLRENNFLEGICSLKKLTNMPSGVTFGHNETSVEQQTNSI